MRYGAFWACAMSMGSVMEVWDLQVLPEMVFLAGLDPIFWLGVNVACQDLFGLNVGTQAQELELVVMAFMWFKHLHLFEGVFPSMLVIQLEWIFGSCKKHGS